MNPDDPRHGTNGGYRAHVAGRDKDGEPCRPCRDAHAAYKRGLWRKKYLRRIDALYVDSLGTTRRIRALQALGWRLVDIDMALGHGDGRQKGGPNYSHNLTRQPKVHIDTAKAVDAIYSRMSMELGPSEKTRGLARKYGWAPPLAWDNIDDPREHPKGIGAPKGREPDDIDPVIVDRLLLGERIQSTRAEKEEAMRRWLADGKSAKALCVAHGWQEGRYVARDDALTIARRRRVLAEAYDETREASA